MGYCVYLELSKLMYTLYYMLLHNATLHNYYLITSVLILY